MNEHPNHVEIDASRMALIDMLQRRKQHWIEVQEITERQLQNALDTIASCDKQLFDLEQPAGQQLTLAMTPLLHDAVIYDSREIVQFEKGSDVA